MKDFSETSEPNPDVSGLKEHSTSNHRSKDTCLSLVYLITWDSKGKYSVVREGKGADLIFIVREQ